jgi:hypothetical protein
MQGATTCSLTGRWYAQSGRRELRNEVDWGNPTNPRHRLPFRNPESMTRSIAVSAWARDAGHATQATVLRRSLGPCVLTNSTADSVSV